MLHPACGAARNCFGVLRGLGLCEPSQEGRVHMGVRGCCVVKEVYLSSRAGSLGYFRGFREMERVPQSIGLRNLHLASEKWEGNT